MPKIEPAIRVWFPQTFIDLTSYKIFHSHLGYPQKPRQKMVLLVPQLAFMATFTIVASLSMLSGIAAVLTEGGKIGTFNPYKRNDNLVTKNFGKWKRHNSSPGPTSSTSTSNIVPQAIYDGGFSDTNSVRLRVSNGGAGQSGLIGALANAFIQAQVAAGVAPFTVCASEL